jgi:hypothetical protein
MLKLLPQHSISISITSLGTKRVLMNEKEEKEE